MMRRILLWMALLAIASGQRGRSRSSSRTSSRSSTRTRNSGSFSRTRNSGTSGTSSSSGSTNSGSSNSGNWGGSFNPPAPVHSGPRARDEEGGWNRGSDRRDHGTTHGRPNVVVFIMDDLPFLSQWPESAPPGNNLQGLTVKLESYPTPRIDEFRSESVVFGKSYCGAPKCAPSRMVMLTGRQALSCEYAQEVTLNGRQRNAFAGRNTPINAGQYGTGVSVQTMKMQGRDAEYNIPTVLRDNGYYTGLVGKWHMMPPDDMGSNLDCSTLESQPNTNKYNQCKDLLKDVGFNSIGGWYYGNIKNNQYFSHNPEWMVMESADFMQTAIDNNQPFFLYFASTLTHTPFVAGNNGALAKFDPVDTPAGKLAGAAKDPKGKTSMLDRDEVLKNATNIVAEDPSLDLEMAAKIYWADMQFGALIDVMKRFNIYDETYVIFQSDHGQIAKGLMYEQGTRIINFQRYPKIWAKDSGPHILPHDFVTSNVDLAAAIFQVTEAILPDEYQLDGEPFVTDVTQALRDPDFNQVRDGHSSCRFKFMDAQNSYSMISGDYQYIFRASPSVDTMNDVDKLYRSVTDEEQLYDLREDPSEQDNLFDYRDESHSESRRIVIAEFQTIMREYIDIHCIATNGAQCFKPDPKFGVQNAGYFDIECTGSGDESVGCPKHDNEVCEAGRCVERIEGMLLPTKRPTHAPTMKPTKRPTPSPTQKPTKKPTEPTPPPTPPPTRATPPPTQRPAHTPPTPTPPPTARPAPSPVAPSPVTPSPPSRRSSRSSRSSRSGGSTRRSSTGGRSRGGRGRGSAMLFDGALSMDSESAVSLKDATVKVSTLAGLLVVALAVWLLKWCMTSKKQRERTTYPEAYDMGY